MRRILFLAIFLSLPTSLFADVYMKTRVMNGMGEAETWTSGKKQRMVTQVPMVGEVINITRADLGVEWEIQPSLKAYSERPIPIPYTPGEDNSPLTPEEAAQLKQFDQSLDQAAGEKSSNCESVKLSEGKTVGGFQAEGYRGRCKNDSGEFGPESTVWVSTAGDRTASEIQKEITAFEEARLDSTYSKYPPEERERTKKIMMLMGRAMAQGLMGMPDSEDVRGRLVLALEGASPAGAENEGAHSVVTEVLEAKKVPGDDSRYEAPQGFAKVENLGQLQAQQMMDKMASGETDLSSMINDLGKAVGVPQENTPMTPEETQNLQDFNALGRGVAQELRNPSQAAAAQQPAAVQNTGLPPQKDLGNSFGAYDSSQNYPPAYEDSAAPQQATTPEPQGYEAVPGQMQRQPAYPAQQAPYNPQNQYRQNNSQQNMQSTIAAGQQLVGQIQQLVSTFQGGGGFDMSQYQTQGYDEGYSEGSGGGEESSYDSSESGESYDENYDANRGSLQEGDEVVEETVTRRVIRRKSQN